MRPVAVGLVLLSAVVHVYWNYQVKRSPAPAIYTWWLQTIGAVLFAPFAVWIARPVSIPVAGWWCVAGTALCYAGYFSLIALSYRREDLSRAYPIARGVAPAATVAWGMLFHRENPSLAGWLGIVAICLGVFVLAGPAVFAWGRLSSLPHAVDGQAGKPAPLPLAGILAAIGVGLCTSAYSAVDKEGVQHVHPALYIVLTFAAGALAQGLLLWPGRGWRAFAREARRGGIGLVLAAAFSLGGYLLVLTVLRTEPVSYVVPLRSVSVLLSVLTGAHLLGEAGGQARLVAAALIVLGITAIAVGG